MPKKRIKEEGQVDELETGDELQGPEPASELPPEPEPEPAPEPPPLGVPSKTVMVYQREDFVPHGRDWKRTKELLDAHAMELRGMPSELDEAQYLTLQRQGRLVIITARDERGVLQGYSSHFWHRDLHFNGRVAQDDGIYVVPELRNQGVGTELRKMAIAELKKSGVNIVLGRLKVAHPHDDSMKELGFVPWEQVWLKEI